MRMRLEAVFSHNEKDVKHFEAAVEEFKGQVHTLGYTVETCFCTSTGEPVPMPDGAVAGDVATTGTSGSTVTYADMFVTETAGPVVDEAGPEPVEEEAKPSMWGSRRMRRGSLRS